MSPLQIEALLRLHSRVDPFEGYTREQRYSPAMHEAYAMFHRYRLVQPWVEIGLCWPAASRERLTEAGIDLIYRLVTVQP
jgi:hypothetical protein